MWLLAILSLLVLVNAGSILHPADVDVDQLPSLHQRDFLEILKNPSRKRALLEIDGFFKIEGVMHNGEEHHFILKPAMTNPLYQIVDGNRVVDQDDIYIAPVFNGYSASDHSHSLAISFPHPDSLKPLGQVHWVNGQVHTWHHDEEKGLHLKHNSLYPNEVEEKLSNIISESRKRDFNSGVPSNAPMIEVQVGVETEPLFCKKLTDNSIEGGLNYMRTLLAAANAVFERDVRITQVFEYYAHRPDTSVATDIFTLNNWLRLSEQQHLLPYVDIMVIMTGTKGGGTGYVNAACGSSRTGDVGANALYGKGGSSSPNDFIIWMHEVGHLMGGAHTHDAPEQNSYEYGFSPLIDTCGNDGAVPVDGGIIMSYCQLARNNKGWANTNPFFGYINKFGDRSERCSVQMRKNTEGKASKPDCLSSPDSFTPPCIDNPDRYTYRSTGQLIDCSIFTSKDHFERTFGTCDRNRPICPKICGHCPGPISRSVRPGRRESNTPTPRPPPTPTPTPTPRPTPTPTPTPRPTPTPTPIPRPTPTPTSMTCDDIPPTTDFTCQQIALRGWCCVASNARHCRISCGKGCGTKRSIEGIQEVFDVHNMAQFTPPNIPSQVLYDQSKACSNNNRGVPSFRRLRTLRGVIAVDDFTVPGGQQWDLTSVKISGRSTSPLVNTDVDVLIYHQKSIWCNMITKATSVPSALGGDAVDITIDLRNKGCSVFGARRTDDGIRISDQTYWLNVAPVVPLVDGHARFDWATSTTDNGYPFYLRDRDDLFQEGRCVNDYGVGADCGIASVPTNDLCFSVEGIKSVLTVSSVLSTDKTIVKRAGSGHSFIGPPETRGLALTADVLADIELAKTKLKESYGR